MADPCEHDARIAAESIAAGIPFLIQPECMAKAIYKAFIMAIEEYEQRKTVEWIGNLSNMMKFLTKKERNEILERVKEKHAEFYEWFISSSF